MLSGTGDGRRWCPCNDELRSGDPTDLIVSSLRCDARMVAAIAPTKGRRCDASGGGRPGACGRRVTSSRGVADISEVFAICFEGTAKDVVLGGASGSKMRARPSLPAKTSSSSVSSSVLKGTHRLEDALELPLLGFKRLAGGFAKFACLTNDCLAGGANCVDCACIWVN